METVEESMQIELGEETEADSLSNIFGITGK